jgi:hypothetical protein
MGYYKKLLSIVGMGLLLNSGLLLAAETSANAVLMKAYKYIGSLDTYAFDAVVLNDDTVEKKSTKHYKHTVTVKVDRPDDLRIDIKGDVKNRSIYLHEGVFTIFDHAFGYYGQLDLPQKSIDGALDYIFDSYGIKAPLAALIYSDMYKRSKFTKSVYFGTRTVGGEECDYVAFRNAKSEVHVWILRGDKPLIKSFTLIDKSEKGTPKTSASIKWYTDIDIPKSTFIFHAPKEAVAISIKPAN